MKSHVQIAATICLLWLPGFNAFAIADKDGPKIGDAPPPLSLGQVLAGPREISWATLKGKVVVLEFWATWCAPCVAAIPHMNELAEQFKDKPLAFLSVTSENEDVVRSFLKQRPIQAWVGLDDYEVLKNAFHVRGIPHAVIVGADGRIAAITHPATLQARHLDEVLAGKKCSLPEPEVYTTNAERADEVESAEGPSLFEISIRERKLAGSVLGPTCTWSRDPVGCGFKGKLATIESGLQFVFGKTPARMALSGDLPETFYDFTLRAPAGRGQELESQFIAALRTTFSLEVKRTVRDMDAFVLTQVSTNAPGFHLTLKRGGGGQTRGGFRLNGVGMDIVVKYMELALDRPVLDETGLQGLFDVDMKWEEPDERSEYHPKPEAVIEAAGTRLGLRLTPVRRPVEVLEVRHAAASADE